MSLKIGIVGLPNVGKSTLFNALTRKKVDISNYPFCTIEPNVGVVEVPDTRLQKLANFSHSKKVIPAAVEFVDIAGLVKGAAEGEGLGNKFLSHIKEVDAIAEVIRIFDDPDIIHVAGLADPVSDIDVLEYELILKDLESIEKRLPGLESDKRGKVRGAEEKLISAKAMQSALHEGIMLKKYLENLPPSVNKEHEAADDVIRELQLLTAKPIIYVFNASEAQIRGSWTPEEDIAKKIAGFQYAVISAKIESELNELDDVDRREYLEDLKLKESGLDRLIRLGYETLGLMTFLTTGEDETRAWTIPIGSKAPRAGRAIHTDFEERFIRAEIIAYNKLLEAGTWGKARELGWLRTEGKEYVVKDGDVIEFKV